MKQNFPRYEFCIGKLKDHKIFLFWLLPAKRNDDSFKNIWINSLFWPPVLVHFDHFRKNMIILPKLGSVTFKFWSFSTSCTISWKTNEQKKKCKTDGQTDGLNKMLNGGSTSKYPFKCNSKNKRTTSMGLKGYLPNELQPYWADLTKAL